MKSAPGQFVMTLAPNITLTVTRSDDGQITVVSSKGLFAFPYDRIHIAQMTGMWDESLTDAQAAKRMKDEGFFEYLEQQIKKKTSNIISLGPNDQFKYEGKRFVINNTDQPIEAGDYVVYTEEYWCYEGPNANYATGDWDFQYDSEKKTLTGKAIPPHGRVGYDHFGGSGAGVSVTGISLRIPKEELQQRFAPYTGNEYNEYLQSRNQ